MGNTQNRLITVLASIAVTVCGATVVAVLPMPPASAQDATVSYDALRTGWDPNEPGLTPSDVAASDFGQLYATQLDGQIYAQPVVAKGVVLAATENDKVYGLNAGTGAVQWTRDVGPFWPASAIGCGDLTPNIGVTATPVYDAVTGTAYFTAKVNDGPDADHPHWYLHGVDITTGVERSGFPTTITGSPTNDPSNAFNPKTAMQRPGLLLLGGVVYAGFASLCDHGPFVGYVVGVNAGTGRLSTIWAAEVGSSDSEAGIWQSGGGLVSDGPGRIILTTGNGVSPAPGPGNAPPSTLAESVVRLAVNGDGSLSAKDFFSPVNNTKLDVNDADLGAGSPLALPDGYGTTEHPHLLVQVGKDGRVFLLDRDNLGGVKQGPGGTDAVLQKVGPYNGVWGHGGFWGGDGGYVYLIENSGYLRAYQIGAAGNGLPTLTATGTSPGTWGYTSGSPVLTSTGRTSGSALVWAIYSSGSNGSGGQLRAYDALPSNGQLALRYAAPIGTATKFGVPATDGGRVFTGTRDGRLFGFGRPTTVALSGSPTDYGNVAVAKSVTRDVTVTATTAVTVTGVSTAGPFAVGAVTLPVTLAAGQKLTVPVTFTPMTTGALSGTLALFTGAGKLEFDLHGTGTKSGLSAAPAALNFGTVPTGGKVTYSVNITNSGTAAVSITAVTAPVAPFSAGSLPAIGSTLAAGAAVSVPITFTPTAAGAATGQLMVTSEAGPVTVSLTGTGVTGASHLTITPPSLDFGAVPVGSTVTRTFDISNTGNLLLTLTKAAPPAAPFGTGTPVSEGQQLNPGQTIHQSISFSPTVASQVSGTYHITGDDGQGAQSVTVTGTGTPRPGTTVPAPSAGGWTTNGAAVQSGGDTILTPAAADRAGDVIYPVPVSTLGLHVTFTAQISGGTGADGLTFMLLDPAKAGPTSLGGSGGSLGYGGLIGVAVTLDTYQNAKDPSTNFLGIATAGGVGGLHYVATAPAPTSLRTGTHLVDITVQQTNLSVSLDGGPALLAHGPVEIPAKALVGFSAGTGGSTDTHTIRSVSITRTVAPPAHSVGPIVGLAGKCVDVSNAGTANGTAVQLYTCNGTGAQSWTVQGDGSLRALGKCLDVTHAGTANRTPVQLWTCNGTVAQVWQAQPDGTLRNPNAGRCLNVTGGNPADSTRLIIYDCAAVANERWTLPG